MSVVLRSVGVLAVAVLVLAGCAKPPEMRESLLGTASIDSLTTGATAPRATFRSSYQPMPGIANAQLSGRTVTVGATEQIVLRPGEVVLTFDDGPRPGTTDSILATLDQFGVKATFLMLGSSAERHPALVRKVAEHGHTIGTHTYDHVDLSKLDLPEAVAEIYAGQQAVAAALAPAERAPSRFFRFPYLAQTGLIRTSAVDSRFIVLDVDIDSKDYYKETAEQVLERTLARLDARGGGIILFHDIHLRTAELLPEFLTALRERNYSVVGLRSTGGGVFDMPVVIAEGPSADLI
ncbi:polysaccharide deacetylase family protein [Pelagibacterium sp.]|uniref:polysaccharide deacetylase family protein n=1 Tax=Pelagibacterium sp. TaxID=1967288 RepID=UPI002D80059D|nr:polysaccharide deacetylase family protein [Pelagibacterium sp.]